MQATLNMTLNDFYEEYQPQRNHLDNNASWDGTLYETFGNEMTYCFELSKKDKRVWTIVECDKFDEESTCLIIKSGFHYVDHVGYLITRKPYTEKIKIEIDL